MRRTAFVLGAAALTSLLGACGGDDASSTSAAPRVVDVAMEDNRFTPSAFEASVGDVVIFRFTNRGTSQHEAVIGDAMFQQGHVDHQHVAGMDRPSAALVEPGEQVDIPYKFMAAGEVLIGCHVDGHWEDGMVATIQVADA